MNHARDGLCVAANDDFLYAISGYDGDRYLKSIERYDPEKNVWEMQGIFFSMLPQTDMLNKLS